LLHPFSSAHVGTVHHPAVQVASAESCEALAVQPGRWYDVPGLTQISYTDNGEKAAARGLGQWPLPTGSMVNSVIFDDGQDMTWDIVG